MKEYARLGAELRLKELEAEMIAILPEFPDMRSARKRTSITGGIQTTRGITKGGVKMSAAARKRISEAQKKRWAALKR